MKLERHAKILELIEAEPIDTQEGLLARLREHGFSATQATVSRDIRELGLQKVRTDKKTYRYVTPDARSAKNIKGRFAGLFLDVVNSVACAQNLIVVKCHTGMANAACEALDVSDVGEKILGTLSGDNTFLVVMPDNESAARLASRLQHLLKQESR